MTSERRLIPQPGERWLLRDGGRCYAVPASLGRRLRDGEDMPELDAALASAPPAAAGRSLWLGLPLVPARCVAALAERLATAASWPGLAAAVLVGVAGYATGGSAPTAGAPWPAVVAVVIAAGLVHELGHAAALARGGGRPGVIGIGALFVFPVLFCDVTAAALLPRAARARVDVAGAAFHLAAGGLMSVAGSVWNAPALSLAAWGVLAATTWSALPFLRTDGYWLLCDMLGLDTLEAPAPPGADRGLRLALIAWRLGSLGFLGVIASAMARRAWWVVGLTEGLGEAARIGILAAAVLLGGVVAFGLGRRAWRLARTLGGDLAAMFRRVG